MLEITTSHHLDNIINVVSDSEEAMSKQKLQVSDEESSSRKTSRSRKDRVQVSSSSKKGRKNRKKNKALSPPRRKVDGERDGRKEAKERRKDKKALSTTGKTHEKKQDRRKQGKKVRFCDRVRRRNVRCVPEDDHDDIWYTSEDYDDKLKREYMLQKTVSSNKEDVNDPTQENLNSEYVLTDEQQMKANRIIEESLEAVFNEQKRQERAFNAVYRGVKFSLDSSKISVAYHSHSEKALKEAQRRAAKHERHLEAIGILNLKRITSPSSKRKMVAPSTILARPSDSLNSSDTWWNLEC